MTATAQDNGRWALCAAPLLEPVAGDAEARATGRAPVRISADQASVSGSPPVYEFTGGVMLRRGDQTFTGEQLRYDTGAGEIQADGAIRLRESGLLIAGERARYWLAPERGRFEGVSEYRIAAGHLQGRAERIIREGPTVSRYEGVTLSTCLPGREFWTLRAGSAEIDTQSRQGRARDAVLAIGGLPVFYTPYLQFPVGDERLSGFLAPTIGQSQASGATVALPWYWNIAPDRDATLTPTLYGKRGLMLGGEFRYLEDWVEGEIDGSYLPDDDAFGEDRWSIDQDHRLAVGGSLRGRLHQQRVSDPFYTDDFSNDFDTRSAAFLESEASLAWARNGFTASVDTQYWQQIDQAIQEDDEPYAREPRLRLGYNPVDGIGPLDYSLNAEVTEFTHPVSERTRGRRVDMAPRIALPWRRLGYYLEPAVTWRYTDYDLDGTLPGDDATPSRSMPLYTLDAGLFLERPGTLFDGVYQTLEPRLFYRYAPKRDQSDLPVFDSAATTLTYSGMFRETTFSGPDRIEDGERLTTGVTTRFVDERSGREYLRASVGQIHYFGDREVAADGDPARNQSEIITELRLNLPRGFSASTDYRWDPETSGNRSLRALLRWQGGSERIVNLGLRQRERDGDTTLDQAEASFTLPVATGWRLFGGLLQDLQGGDARERFLGVEQAGCCHAWRLVSRESLQRDPDRDGARLERAFMLELELRGLGGIGDRIRPFLRDEIDGYDPGR